MNTNASQTLESMSQATWYNQWTLKKFRNFLGGKILEVGCGIGNFTNTLAKFGQVYAIDINRNYLSQNSKSKAMVGFGDIEKGDYFFKNQKFDSIVCLNVLEHIRNDDQALANIHQLLKDQGVLVLLVPAHPFLYGKIDQAIGHFRRYGNKEILNKLRRAKFRTQRLRRLNFLGAIGWYISGKILKDSAIENEKIKIFNLLAPLVLILEDLKEPPIGTSFLIIAKK